MATDRPWGFRTRAVHAGAVPDAATGARAVPIYQSTSFVFDDTADAANLFALQKYGNIYSRIANPTVAVLEERLASLEGALGAVATSSGQAAEFLTFATLAGAGDHIVAAAALYGGTVTQLDVTLRRFGVDTTFVPGDDPDAFRAAITDRTRCVFAEIVANPSGEVTDVAALAEVAHERGLPLIIDATMATPYLCRPMEHGADIVIHSATKFLGGHGTTLGGVILESGRFDWGNGHFPQMTDPIPSYGGLTWWGNFQEYGFLTKIRSEQLRDVGATLSAHSAFLLLQGIETLPQRMDCHVANAQRVAEWLEADERVAWVSYAGLPGHPHHAAGEALPPAGPGRGVQLRGPRRRRGRRARRGTAVHRVGAALQPPRQHRRRPHARAAPRVDHPPAADRRPAARGRRPAGPHPHQRRDRGRRRHPLGPRPGPDRGDEGGRVSTWTPPTAQERQAILRRTHSVAMVGASPNPARASNFVATYLLGSTGFDVYFVNPNASEILGRPVYPSLDALPVTPDLVDVFRRPEDLPDVLDATIAAGASTFWTQFGLYDEQLAERGVEAGLTVVMDRCLKVEHARFHGGLHLAGFDTGVISARKR